MTETKFTPAPWEYDGEYIWADSIQGYVADPNTDDMTSGKYLPTFKAQATIEANARLIAAAPDMYAALQNILNGIETGAITSDHEKTFANAIKQAREAIKRAEGK